MVELVDTYALGAYAIRCAGSNPVPGTITIFRPLGDFWYNRVMNKLGFIKFKTILINLFIIAIVVGIGFLGYTWIKEKKLFINEWFLGEGLRGVDISSYQAEVDMKSLANQGIRFVYMKATEGSNHVDEKFATNWKNIKDTNMAAGADHFFLVWEQWGNTGRKLRLYSRVFERPFNPGSRRRNVWRV